MHRGLLAAFNEQVRRNPRPGPGSVVETDGRVVRVVSEGAGWSGVVWSDLEGTDADAAVAAQLARYDALAQPWEWKWYSYDTPEDLPERLGAAGLVPDPAETLLVAEIAELQLDELRRPEGIELFPVVDEIGVRALVDVHDQVFGDDNADIGRRLLAGLAERPSSVAAVLAVADGMAVSAGRVEFNDGTDFASLWGGGTLSAWRGRGVFRAVVAYRAALARDRGFRYLQVDASPQSRPILERLGFVALATTVPYKRR